MPLVCSGRHWRRCGKNDMKAFFSTLAITLCLVLLLGGILWADVRTRAVTFEDSTPPYAVRRNRLNALPLTAAGEMLRYLYRGERALLTFLSEKAENIA